MDKYNILSDKLGIVSVLICKTDLPRTKIQMKMADFFDGPTIFFGYCVGKSPFYGSGRLNDGFDISQINPSEKKTYYYVPDGYSYSFNDALRILVNTAPKGSLLIIDCEGVVLGNAGAPLIGHLNIAIHKFITINFTFDKNGKCPEYIEDLAKAVVVESVGENLN